MHLFQYFLLNTANKCLQLHFHSTMSASSNSYCGAVQFLLTTYAAEEEVNGECRKIFVKQQKSGENEREFGIRIQAQAGRLVQAFTEDNLMTGYLNGVPENARTYVSEYGTHCNDICADTDFGLKCREESQVKDIPTYQSTPVSIPPVRRQPRTNGLLYTIEAKHSDSTTAPQSKNQFKINNNWIFQDNNAQDVTRVFSLQ
jgi:hypothetical protein